MRRSRPLPPLCLAPLALVTLATLVGGCASSVRRFPLREPMWTDDDTAPRAVGCHPDPKKDDPGHVACAPREYVSSFAWDAADNTLFRPLSHLFAVERATESVNVNSVDEVPDSSWFTNRIGKQPMALSEFIKGPCGKQLDPEHAAPGSWKIDKGKANGANPGFRIKVEGVGKFMLKSDPPDQPERATGATSIATRFYHAAGWWSACDTVVYFDPKVLALQPGLTVTDNTGVTKPFDEEGLEQLLAGASHRGELVRMVASEWLPGEPLGPFKYEGTRDDDPADVVPHEDRRDLRGARVIAAWLNHLDSREQNTMTTWMRDKAHAKDDSAPGYIRHWYIDLGDCFGSEWDWEGISKRLGFAYYFDFDYVMADFATFGLIERPWDRAERDPDAKIFGFFSEKDFEPGWWKGGYPNPAFARMTERDGAWATRILARFTTKHIEAAVRVGDYTDPKHEEFLVRVLEQRHGAILRRYLSKLSPVTDLALEPSVATGTDGAAATQRLCGVDLARWTGVFGNVGFTYSASLRTGADLDARRDVTAVASPDSASSTVCLELPHFAADGGAADDDAGRYAIAELKNGQALGTLQVHLYDLGPKRGFRLVGIERPEP